MARLAGFGLCSAPRVEPENARRHPPRPPAVAASTALARQPLSDQEDRHETAMSHRLPSRLRLQARQPMPWVLGWHQDPLRRLAHLSEVPAGCTSSWAPSSVWGHLGGASPVRTVHNGRSAETSAPFLPATWRAMRRRVRRVPLQASAEAQITVAERVLDDVGWRRGRMLTQARSAMRRWWFDPRSPASRAG